MNLGTGCTFSIKLYYCMRFTVHMHPNVQSRGIGKYFFFLWWKSYCFITLFVICVPASSLKIQVSIWMAQPFHLDTNTGVCKSLCRLCVRVCQLHTCSLHIPAALVLLGLGSSSYSIICVSVSSQDLPPADQPSRCIQSVWPHKT